MSNRSRQLGRDILLSLLFALWPSVLFADEKPSIDWSDPVEVAAGEAVQERWQMNESNFRYVDDPTVALTDGGYAGVVWGDQEVQELYFQSYGPDGRAQFDKPVNVSQTGGIFSWLPRVGIREGADGGPGEVYVLWQEIVFSGGSHGGEIFFSRSGDGGASFSEPLNLSNSVAGAGKGRQSEDLWHNGSLDLVLGPQGAIYAVWTEYEGRLWLSRSHDGGRSFSEPVHIAGNDDEPARAPSLALDGEGRLHLVWTVGEDRSADLRYARSTDGGETFDDPRIIVAGDGLADAPKLAADSAGTLHLVYGESPRGFSPGSRVLYSQREAGSATFSEPREISSGPGLAGAGAGFPALALDAEDHLYVLWERFPAFASRSQGLGFTRSTDGGESFAPARLIPGTGDPEHGDNGSRQGLLMNKLAVNAHGAIAVVNSTFRPHDRSAIWLIRGE